MDLKPAIISALTSMQCSHVPKGETWQMIESLKKEIKDETDMITVYRKFAILKKAISDEILHMQGGDSGSVQ